MRMRPDQREAARKTLIEAAGRRFRRDGMAGIGIDAIAKATGQTSGAVYAHFAGKAELFAAVVEDGLRRLEASAVAQRAAGGDLASFAARYLSMTHRDAVEEGCLLPALSADIARAPDAVRTLYARRLRDVAHALAPPEREQTALAVLALCAGGILLARATADAAEAEVILAGCRAAAVSMAAA